MTTLRIQEYELLLSDANGVGIAAPRAPAVATSVIDYSDTVAGSGTLSGAFNARTKYIVVEADSDCEVEVGLVAPTMGAGSVRLQKDVPQFFGVKALDKLRVRALDDGLILFAMSDTTSNQTMTTPTDFTYEITSFWYEYVSTATAGNRIVKVEIAEPNGYSIFSWANLQAASLDNIHCFVPGAGEATTTAAAGQGVDNIFIIPFPRLLLPGGSTVQVRDATGTPIDASDTLAEMNMIAVRTADSGYHVSDLET